MFFSGQKLPNIFVIIKLLKFNGDKMYIWFFICVLAVIGMIPLHFLSVEHIKLQKKYGKEKGKKIGEIYGLISGWGLFIFWIGIWISPQSRFSILILQKLSILVPIVNSSIPLFHLIISIFFLIPGAWFAIRGVKETTLKAAETHRTEKIVTKGVYSIIRHPQYLGGLLAHVGISFLFSAWYSLLFTPLMVVLIYLISKKEEEELIGEFGKEYEDYKKKAGMFLPKYGKRS
jgi:protein-S-isoprenylcysteine O-methyltransferase Ste14